MIPIRPVFVSHNRRAINKQLSGQRMRPLMQFGQRPSVIKGMRHDQTANSSQTNSS